MAAKVSCFAVNCIVRSLSEPVVEKFGHAAIAAISFNTCRAHRRVLLRSIAEAGISRSQEWVESRALNSIARTSSPVLRCPLVLAILVSGHETGGSSRVVFPETGLLLAQITHRFCLLFSGGNCPASSE